MQVFFCKFFSTPSHPVFERRSIGSDVPALHSPYFQILAIRRPGSAKRKHDQPPQPTPRFRSVAPESSAVIAEPRMELPQRVRGIFLVVG